MLISAAGRVVRRVEAAALRLAIPGVCGLCGGPGQWDRCRAGLDLCRHCEAALPRATVLPGASAALLLSPFDYAPPVDFMIQQLKFGGDRGFARTLGLLMAEARLPHGAPLPEVLVPVPLHLDRLRERGYNQAAELARFAAGRLRAQVRPRALLRTRATQAQSGLPASRRAANVRGCFAPGEGEAARIRGRCCALVDDVRTTGSTVGEAAATLLGMGAARVEIWTAATPRFLPGPRAGAKQPPWPVQ